MTKKKWQLESFKMILICSLSFLLFNFLTTVSLNIFIPAVAELKEISVGTLYNANTIGNLIAAAFALVVGILSKKTSLKSLSVVGLIMGGISYILIPIVPNHFTGVFIATNYIATMLYAQITIGARIGNWYPIRKGEILGIATSSMILSTLVLLPLYSRAVTHYGIAQTMSVVGVIVIIVGIVSIFLINDYPQTKGLYPENMTQKEYEISNLNVSAEKVEKEWTYRELLKNHRFVLFSLGWGLCMPGMMGLSIAVVPIMTQRGITATQAVTIAMFSGIPQFLGDFVSGFMDTRLGQRFTINFFLILEIIGLIVFGFAPEGYKILLIIGYYLVMFMFGTPNNLQPSSYITLSGGGGSSFMIFYSLATTIAAVVRAFASSILAFSTENYNGSYVPALGIFLVACILAVILMNLFGFKKIEKRN